MKKIAICIPGKVSFSNFVESGALSKLEEAHSISLLSKEKFKETTKYQIPTTVVVTEPRPTYAKVSSVVSFLSMMRYKKRSTTFEIKSEKLFIKKLSLALKCLSYFLSAPLVFEAINCLSRNILYSNRKLREEVKKIDPDLMIIISSFNDEFSLQCLRTANKLRKKSLMIMANWDNVSSKGVLPEFPTALCVWGEQTKELAIRIHNFRPEAVHVIGSPQFEAYINQPASKQLTKAIPARKKNQKMIGFLGTARFRDELSLLKEIDNAIRQGPLSGCHVFYRPHPWVEQVDNSKHFFDYGFDHVSIDKNIEDHYRLLLTQTTYDQKSFRLDPDHAKVFLNSLDGVISSLTTMGIEAMLCGKPILLPVFGDSRAEISLDSLYKYDHHQYWKKMRHVIINHDRQQFISKVGELIQLIDQKPPTNKIKAETKYLVYSDGKKYTSRLLNVVEKIMGA